MENSKAMKIVNQRKGKLNKRIMNKERKEIFASLHEGNKKRESFLDFLHVAY